MVWAIGPNDSPDTLELFQQQMGLTFPVLYDEGGDVHDQYSQQTAFDNTIYPQDWIIGVDGRVAYVSSDFQAAEMIAVIEEELALAE